MGTTTRPEGRLRSSPMTQRRNAAIAALSLAFTALAGCSADGDSKGATVELLNVSYDPTRELYTAINPKFAAKRSEEHTSELQSLMRISYAVFCLKKKKIPHNHITTLP